MTYENMDNSVAVAEWLNAREKDQQIQYRNKWELWIEYCKSKGLFSTGDLQLEDMKRRRLSNDQTEKFFYDIEVPKFFHWLISEYKQKKGNMQKKNKNEGKHLAESSALSVTTAVRSFFAFHRYSLEIKKDALPSSEKIKGVFEDHAFDIFQLRAMFQQGDLFERTVLACGKDLFMRAGDFCSLDRDFIELHIQREKELAGNEQRETDIVEFELVTEKESEPCSCHFSRETTELLIEYLKTYPKKNGHLFALTEDALNDLLRRLAEKAKITLTGRIRWHCLRKFGVTLMHGRVEEPVLKYMTGKHISKDLKTYIQNNRETYKAFKKIEPLISLTKTNGNGNGKLAKDMEELKKNMYKQKIVTMILERLLTPEQKQEVIESVQKELGIALSPTHPTPEGALKKLSPFPTERKELTLEDAITELADILEEQEQEAIEEEANGDE